MNYGPTKHTLTSDGSKRPTFRLTIGEDEFSIYGDVGVELGEEVPGAGVPVRVTPSIQEGKFMYVVYGVNEPTEAEVLEGYLTAGNLMSLELGL